MNKDVEVARPRDDDTKFEQVPVDFPRPMHRGAVPGTQPKLLMTSYNGRFYSPGCTPPAAQESPADEPGDG